ncbi:hypothetical protein BJ508DRAFT_414548 [Ascobolus immersus RN42]|uniref:choline-phosphate cytidylyltransferase n=1 Tax=Ascobolus immersus RN42 TaxID=1160509 RepID=A0A3N4I8N6_ASCIM|nr:hypothetical protein BJ508DRAFT_414548 [Ascobolus immersus RN42]
MDSNQKSSETPVRIYADGVFDLFHLGHMRQLEQAKKCFPNTYLLVGIPSDAETHKRKGITVLTDKERAESLRHCKWVDEVIEDAPWIVTEAFLEKHNIDFVAHDDEPYSSGDSDDIYQPLKEAGKFIATKRTDGISTTYIITKIVREYDNYINRQLNRGTPREELNVSWLKKNELVVKRHMSEITETVKHNWYTTGKELREEFKNYWNPGRAPIRGVANRSVEPNATCNQTATDDFATGYLLGLVGGVRSWMRSRSGPSQDDLSERTTTDGLDVLVG